MDTQCMLGEFEKDHHSQITSGERFIGSLPQWNRMAELQGPQRNSITSTAHQTKHLFTGASGRTMPTRLDQLPV